MSFFRKLYYFNFYLTKQILFKFEKSRILFSFIYTSFIYSFNYTYTFRAFFEKN